MNKNKEPTKIIIDGKTIEINIYDTPKVRQGDYYTDGGYDRGSDTTILKWVEPEEESPSRDTSYQEGHS